MSDFLFYISLDRVCPEKRHAMSGAVVTSRNNKIARSAHPTESPPPLCTTTLPHARSRIATKKSSSSCSHHLGALFQPQIRSRGRDEVFEVGPSSRTPFSSHPLAPLAAPRFAAKHSGDRARRKLFINVKTGGGGATPFARSCCGVKGIHSPQLSATRTSFAEFPHETSARLSRLLSVFFSSFGET